MTILSRPRFLKSISTDNETKTEQTESLVAKFSWWELHLIIWLAPRAGKMNQISPALWLATRAGKMELSCPVGTTRRVPQEKFLRKAYNKFLIDQACSVKMAWYWPCSFFASLWTSTPSRSINTQKKQKQKKELDHDQYPAILTSHLVIKPYICSWIVTIVSYAITLTTVTYSFLFISVAFKKERGIN